jgi:hypothetical protein
MLHMQPAPPVRIGVVSMYMVYMVYMVYNCVYYCDTHVYYCDMTYDTYLAYGVRGAQSVAEVCNMYHNNRHNYTD